MKNEIRSSKRWMRHLGRASVLSLVLFSGFFLGRHYAPEAEYERVVERIVELSLHEVNPDDVREGCYRGMTDSLGDRFSFYQAPRDEADVIFKEKAKPPVLISSVRLLDHSYAVLRLDSFSKEAGLLLRSAIAGIKLIDPDGIILDLRGNGGGSLDVAVSLTSAWAGKRLVTKTVKRNGQAESYFGVAEPTLSKYPVVIIVDAGTASASEVVAVALRDYGFARIIGVQTVGKGVGQDAIPLENGARIYVESFKWFSPNGTSIQGKGITPDLPVITEPELVLENEPAIHLAAEVLANPEGLSVARK